jgi:hypothetical protein
MEGIRHDLLVQLGYAANLFKAGAVNFKAIYEDLKLALPYLDEGDIDILRKKVTEKIFDILKTGTFNDLYGVRNVVELLELNYELPDDIIHFFNFWISKTDILDWSALGRQQSPLSDEYNLEAARTWASRFVNETGITDELLVKLLNFRHVFIYWFENRVNQVGASAISEILANN